MYTFSITLPSLNYDFPVTRGNPGVEFLLKGRLVFAGTYFIRIPRVSFPGVYQYQQYLRKVFV